MNYFKRLSHTYHNYFYTLYILSTFSPWYHNILTYIICVPLIIFKAPFTALSTTLVPTVDHLTRPDLFPSN